MTVEELISQLKKLPKDKEVTVGLKVTKSPLSDSIGKFWKKASSLVVVYEYSDNVMILGTDGTEGNRARTEITTRDCPLFSNGAKGSAQNDH